jgi:crossover junction endodeoxyribonuclease RusA
MVLLDADLPYPPSVNHYWKSGRKKLASGKIVPYRFKSPKACKFISDVKLLVGRCNTSLSRLGIELQVYPPDNRTRDIDNILKAVLDSLVTCGLMQDDEQIDDLRVIRCDRIKGGKIRVRLFEIA